MSDASFEQGAEEPLRLRAESEEDLKVLAALAQDALATVGDVAWMPGVRRFAAVVNRFRWEDKDAAERAKRPYERVRAAISVENALRVRARGLSPNDKAMVVGLLDIVWEPGEDGAGTVVFRLAGDGELAVDAEALEVSLTDLSRPWAARGLPEHGLD